jgi:hypothetical protein
MNFPSQRRPPSSIECAHVSWLKGTAPLSANSLARIQDGLLPMLLLPRIRVRSVEARGLSDIELFLLKSLLRHGKLNLDDVELATGIPSGPLQVLLHRLVRQGILSANDVGFTAIRDAAEKAVATRACPETMESAKDFIFLPRTGDLGVLNNAKFKELTEIRPRCQAPVPQEMVGAPIAEVLANTPNCSRHGWEILSVEEPTAMPKLCPAYHCYGQLTNSEQPQLWISFSQDEKRISSLDFSFADALAKEIVRLSSLSPPLDRISRATQRLFPKNGAVQALSSAEMSGPSRLSLPMSRSLIEGLIPNELLVTPAAIAAQWESPAAVLSIQYEVRFKPKSVDDAVSFAIDNIVQQLCSRNDDPHPSMATWIEGSCNEFKTSVSEITTQKIVNRLWALGEFTRAYTLQEAELFEYD